LRKERFWENSGAERTLSAEFEWIDRGCLKKCLEERWWGCFKKKMERRGSEVALALKALIPY
jgi:hypothetical protein